jgi:fructosamine-3-kinase
MDFKQNTLKIINKEVENSLSQKFGQQVTILSSGSIGGGCINHASKINTNVGQFFLKWNANCVEDIFLREAESLRELKKAIGNELIVPEVYAAKLVNDTPGFLVQEYLPTRYSASGDDEKLGRGLALIHQFKNEKFGFYHNNYCGDTIQNNSWKTNWAEFFRDNRLGFLLNLIQNERVLPVSEIKIYDKLLQKIPKLLPSSSEPALIHGDLWSGNFMITERGPALIDPASYYADREMEMGIMTMFGGFSSRFYDAYNHVYQLPSDWRERNQLYQLYHVLNHYFLFGGGYQNQAIQIARYYAGS